MPDGGLGCIVAFVLVFSYAAYWWANRKKKN